MRSLLWVGILLVILWALGWLVFRIASALIHIVLVVGIILAIMAVVRRGARTL
jgi:hypothetical protein